MPSGLTYQIYEGTDMSLRSFALKCATQFGLGYKASSYGDKELPLDKPPVLTVDEYRINSLKKAKEDALYWLNMEHNPDEAMKLYREYVAKKEEEKSHQDGVFAEQKDRYLQMISKVEAWDCGEDLQYLKDYMLKQLNECMEHDCPDTSKWYDYPIPTFEKWLRVKIDCACSDVKLQTESLEKEEKAIKELNEGLQNLYSSLDKAEPLFE